MCVSPIRVLNRSRFYNSQSLKYNFAPCGKCVECLSSKSSDITYRLLNEFLYTRRQGFNAYFLTFTYNDSNLPYIDRIPCFRHTDMVNFIKVLRKKYNLSYYGVSEFGSLNHRPHYHFIFFAKERISLINFISYCRSKWNKGFVGVTNQGAVINNSSAISYVTKYISKLDDYVRIFTRNINSIAYNSAYSKLTSLCNRVHFGVSIPFENAREMSYYLKFRNAVTPHFLGNSNLTSTSVRFWSVKTSYIRQIINDEKNFIINEIKSNSFPRTFCSHGLGNNDVCFLSNGLEVAIMTASGLMKFPIPRYIFRKHFCDKQFNPSTNSFSLYKVNSAGIDLLVKKYFDYRNKFVNLYSSFILDLDRKLFKDIIISNNLDYDKYMYLYDFIHDVSNIDDYLSSYYDRSRFGIEIKDEFELALLYTQKNTYSFNDYHLYSPYELSKISASTVNAIYPEHASLLDKLFRVLINYASTTKALIKIKNYKSSKKFKDYAYNS